jgi:hypothetical protein
MVLIRKESLIAATCGGSDKCRIPGADAKRIIQMVRTASIYYQNPNPAKMTGVYVRFMSFLGISYTGFDRIRGVRGLSDTMRKK